MPVTYHNQDCDFTLRGKAKTSLWIKRTAEAEGFRLGNVSVVFCSDRALLEINRQYLDHDYFTDIITFDYTENRRISGDLMISVDTVAENAVKFGQNTGDELMRVIIHGILHLAGHGDKTPEEEKAMRALEDKYLALL